MHRMRHAVSLAVSAASAMLLASTTRAATNVRDAGPPEPELELVAVVSLSSVERAMENLSGALEATASDDAAGIASAVLSWLTMAPSLECADPARPATVVFLTSGASGDLPEQVAIIPLSPAAGAVRLRDSLAHAYAKVEGKTVLYCSGPLDSAITESLSVIFTKDAAYVANSREALRWIARRHMDGSMPSARHLRKESAISIYIDAERTIPVIDALNVADVSDIANASKSSLGKFRDLLAGLKSFQLSFSTDSFAADRNSCIAAVRLEPKKSMEGPRDPSAALAALLTSIPLEAYSISAGLRGGLASLLPASVTSQFTGTTAYSYLAGFNALPGMDDASLAPLLPFLSGERVSAFLVSHAIPWPAKIDVFALKDASGAEKALDAIFSGKPPASIAAFRPSRTSGGHTVRGYTAVRSHGSKEDDDYGASSLVLITELNSVELAIVGDRLVSIAGHPGQIDLWLKEDGFRARERDFPALASTLGPPAADAVVTGAGQLQISRTIRAYCSTRGDLSPLLDLLPRPGNGIEWRISRVSNGVVCEFHISSSELRSIVAISNIDNNFIDNVLMNLIINDTPL